MSVQCRYNNSEWPDNKCDHDPTNLARLDRGKIACVLVAENVVPEMMVQPRQPAKPTPSYILLAKGLPLRLKRRPRAPLERSIAALMLLSVSSLIPTRNTSLGYINKTQRCGVPHFFHRGAHLQLG